MSANARRQRADRNTTMTVHVPMTFERRGGRKIVIVPPDQTSQRSPRARRRDPLIKAVARAHRWRRLLEAGLFGSITEVANVERIDRSYVCKVLRLTLLAPDLIEAIVDAGQPTALALELLLTPFPREWTEQRAWLGATAAA